MDPASITASAATLTTGTLILIAIGMVCAVGIIWWGTMLRRRRAAAVAEANEHAALAGHPVEEGDPEAPSEQTGALPASMPIEPAPVATAPPAIPEPAMPSVADLVPPSEREPTPAASPEPPAPSPQPMVVPLTMLKGLGPKAAAQLNALGIDRINQLAALSPSEATALDARLGAFTGRMTRDRWVEQAKLLEAGDRAGFEATFGKLGG